MSIITPSRLWRGAGRDGSAAAAYSPSSLGEIAISGDLGRSRARCRTWTRLGLRELMSIITPSRLRRGVGRTGSAAAAQSSFISRRDRDLGDLGRSRARCRTWTRCGLRELMSIITPSRLWRGVGRTGSAAAAYSPSSRDEIAISGDLGRSEMSDMDSMWSA